jgi:hypothetical protein
MTDTHDVANENDLVARLTEVLYQGMFTTNAEFILRCAEVGVLVENENADFYYRIDGTDLSYGGGALGEQYTIEEITWVAEGIAELRSIDVEGARTLPVGELVTGVSEWLDAQPELWAARKVA